MRRGDRGRRGKSCRFCSDKVRVIDYKDLDTLRMSVARTGRMLPRRKTGACAKHQRMLSRAIKRARQVALLPYAADHTRPSNY
jgi:small subunit ribosomal protein S18